MDLVLPGIGLTFWMLLVFSVLLVILAKFAWKPILKAIEDREDSIESALQSAKQAKEQMAMLKSDNEQLIKEAREERDAILREARETREKMISDAKKTAEEEGKKMITRAKEEIDMQKSAALTELKSQIAGFSVSVAEKLIGKQLADSKEQQEFIKSQVANLGKGSRVSE